MPGTPGVYSSWALAAPYILNEDIRITKGFNNQAFAELSFNELCIGGVVDQLQIVLGVRQVEFWIVLEGVRPGVYRKRPVMMKKGLDYSYGLVQRVVGLKSLSPALQDAARKLYGDALFSGRVRHVNSILKADSAAEYVRYKNPLPS
jgi:hypothetical protein